MRWLFSPQKTVFRFEFTLLFLERIPQKQDYGIFVDQWEKSIYYCCLCGGQYESTLVHYAFDMAPSRSIIFV